MRKDFYVLGIAIKNFGSQSLVSYKTEEEMLADLNAICGNETTGKEWSDDDAEEMCDLLVEAGVYDGATVSHISDETEPLLQCDNCGFPGGEDVFIEAHDAEIRCSTGSHYSDKECPCCGALAYPSDYASVLKRFYPDEQTPSEDLTARLEAAATDDFWEEADALDPEKAESIRELMAEAAAALRASY